MKKLQLSDPLFDGFIGNTIWHRRSALRMLAESGQKFETPFQKRIKQGKYAVMGFLVISLSILSTHIITDWLQYQNNYDLIMKQLYKGNASEVENNKKTALKKWKIAGSGDQGYREVLENAQR